VVHGNGRVPRGGRRGGALGGGSTAVRCCRRSRGGHGGGAGQGGGGKGAPEQWADGEAAVFNGGGVAPVAVDECGGIRRLEGDQGVRRRQSIEEWSSSVGAHRKGTDGGDTQTESGVEEGLRWWEASEVDAWAVGDERAALGRG
jgi:hypothetical protein